MAKEGDALFRQAQDLLKQDPDANSKSAREALLLLNSAVKAYESSGHVDRANIVRAIIQKLSIKFKPSDDSTKSKSTTTNNPRTKKNVLDYSRFDRIPDDDDEDHHSTANLSTKPAAKGIEQMITPRIAIAMQNLQRAKAEGSVDGIIKAEEEVALAISEASPELQTSMIKAMKNDPALPQNLKDGLPLLREPHVTEPAISAEDRIAALRASMEANKSKVEQRMQRLAAGQQLLKSALPDGDDASPESIDRFFRFLDQQGMLRPEDVARAMQAMERGDEQAVTAAIEAALGRLTEDISQDELERQLSEANHLAAAIQEAMAGRAPTS